MEEQLYNSIILIDEDENEIEFDIMDIIEMVVTLLIIVSLIELVKNIKK